MGPPLFAIALAAVWMKDGCDALGIFTDVAFRLDGVEVSSQELPNPIQMPRHFLNISRESMAKVHHLSTQKRPGRAVLVKSALGRPRNGNDSSFSGHVASPTEPERSECRCPAASCLLEDPKTCPQPFRAANWRGTSAYPRGIVCLDRNL